MIKAILHILFAIICVIIVLFMAYYLTRIYAKKMGTYFGTGKNIKVIDRIPVGKGSSIAVVELQGEQYLLGITEQNITKIDKLEDKIEPAPVQELPQISDLNLKNAFKTLLHKETGENDESIKKQ